VRIVSISTVFPNPQEPGLGVFVRSRLLHVAKLDEMVIAAPVPAIDYSSPRRRWFGAWRVPARRLDGGVEVLHPRWLYPPGGTPLNVVCLFLRLALCLARLRRRFDFDLIDAHFGYPEGVASAALSLVFGRPFTVTIRGSEPVFARSPFRAACIRWALRRASAVFAVSEGLRRFALQCGADPRRVSVVPNGIDEAVFHPRDRAGCRALFGMAAGRRVVACAGEMIEAKGHHLVVEAVRKLLAEGLPVDLYIAGAAARGGAPFQQQIESRIAEAGIRDHVHLTGWLDRERLAELMCAADVFCLASFTEGWPNVVHEALACGAPVVATRVGAVPEMLADESCGIVVPPRAQDPLTDALRQAVLAEWDRGSIARLGQSRSWRDVAAEVVEIMRIAALSRGREPVAALAAPSARPPANQNGV
jgi:glycosyltransferase involved in cell wall biosynthesis